jgi:spore germination cell wall hydrolase CwlJ-like protein
LTIGARGTSRKLSSWPLAATAAALMLGASASPVVAEMAALPAAAPATVPASGETAGPKPAPTLDAGTRCMAMVAYAEAAGEGAAGLAAVVQVIRNRVADGRFPKGPCDVVRAPGEFQPVGDSARLRRALLAPEAQDMATALADFAPVDTAVLAEAVRLAQKDASPADPDPTGGALYFVNPRFMEPAKCPWFADLKRTREIGQHVFMDHYDAGESKGDPALDCAEVKQHWAAFVKAQGARGKRVGRRRINPAWLVEVAPSGLASGNRCQVGTYDPATRTYARAQSC